MEKETSLVEVLKNRESELRSIAPKYVNVKRVMALAIEAKQRNPLLAKCTPLSVVNFCMKMAETGTDRIGAGGLWAVPFWNKKENAYDMTPLPDWRLLIEKARRAKVIKHATAEIVCEKDVFDYEFGLNPFLKHKPAKKERGDLIAVYCIVTLPDGCKEFTVMSKEEVDAIRGRSKASNSGPWVTDYNEMAKKTVIKRALKVFEGASPELTKLIDADNAVVGFEKLELPEPITEPKEMIIEAEVVEEPKEEPKKESPKKTAEKIPAKEAPKEKLTPLEKNRGELYNLIDKLQAGDLEQKAAVIKTLQEQVGIQKEKKIMDFTLPEIKKLIEIIRKQLPPEKEEPKEEEEPKKGGLVCEDCSNFVSKKVAEYSKKNFGGHIYCFNCQKKH